MSDVLKNFFQRPRPYWPQLVHSSGMSFPSGHAMVSFSFYGFIIYLVWQNVKHRSLKYLLTIFLTILLAILFTSMSLNINHI